MNLAIVALTCTLNAITPSVHDSDRWANYWTHKPAYKDVTLLVTPEEVKLTGPFLDISWKDYEIIYDKWNVVFKLEFGDVYPRFHLSGMSMSGFFYKEYADSKGSANTPSYGINCEES